MLLDCLAFFFVGRLHARDQLPVDHLAWISVSLTSSMYTSLLPKFTFLQHSVTLYEMHCTWPWQLWVFVFCFVLPFCMITVLLHIRHARQHGDLTRKALEMGTTVLLFLVPQATNPNFEFHHWFAGFLCGMHANYNTWFSRLTQAWCWGQYMNGIAVWGRDPPLKCAYAYYISTRQGCTGDYSFVNNDDGCWAGLNDSFGDDTPDWRHCTNAN